MIAPRPPLSRVVAGCMLALGLPLIVSLPGCGSGASSPVPAEQAASDPSLINVQRFEAEDQQR